MAERAGISSTDYFCGIAQTGVLTREGGAAAETLPDGTTELMVPPGYVDGRFEENQDRLQGSRQRNLEILTDTSVQKNCRHAGDSPDKLWFLAQAVSRVQNDFTALANARLHF